MTAQGRRRGDDSRRGGGRGSRRAGHELAAGDIVLVRTDCDRFYGQPDYMGHGCGRHRRGHALAL